MYKPNTYLDLVELFFLSLVLYHFSIESFGVNVSNWEGLWDRLSAYGGDPLTTLFHDSESVYKTKSMDVLAPVSSPWSDASMLACAASCSITSSGISTVSKQTCWPRPLSLWLSG